MGCHHNQITPYPIQCTWCNCMALCFIEYEASYWLTGTVHCEPTCQSLKAIEKGYSFHNKANRLQQLYIMTSALAKKQQNI